MQTAALVVTVLAAVAIIVLGLRFLTTPERATTDFGVPAESRRALAATKGVRDITSGVLVLAVWAVGGREALGAALLAVALTPIGDAVIVTTNGGTLRHALTVHGLTAAVLIAAALVLVTA